MKINFKTRAFSFKGQNSLKPIHLMSHTVSKMGTGLEWKEINFFLTKYILIFNGTLGKTHATRSINVQMTKETCQTTHNDHGDN